MKSYPLIAAFCLLSSPLLTLRAEDWPQFNHDCQRTARSADTVPPPYRVRWMWCGAQGTLRNAASQPGLPGWTNDLTSREGYSFPLPDPVSHTLAISAQPIMADGRVFIGDMEGRVYGINFFDGSTLWSNGVGSAVTHAGAVDGSNVIFVCVGGRVAAFDVATGQERWRHTLPRAIVSAPCVISNQVIVTCLDGRVRAYHTTSGTLLWTSPHLGAPIQSGLAADDSGVYLGAENMWFFKLSRTSGAILASNRVWGSSFRMLWPVVWTNMVFVRTCGELVIGSEYIMEAVMQQSPNRAQEEQNIRRWLLGDTNNGAWPDAVSNGHRTLYGLYTSNLHQPYVIPCGPVEGCGIPPEPPCIDWQNRILTWWKTRYPTLLTEDPAFGSFYALDIAGINPVTGYRVTISAPQRAEIMRESDNLYGLSVGGNYLYLRQEFRGAQFIHLPSGTSGRIQARQRYQDGGGFADAHICYVQGNIDVSEDDPLIPDTPQQTVYARPPLAIAGNKLLWCEEFAVVCVEESL
ncbi:MAG: PQQ-binding-like beta-propeller repeat protein [bacterium]|nr:PQQ-binding-like beta-propeller repeat protein [bacterium]